MDGRLRQDRVLRSLRRNGATTVAALAAEVGASRRTVLRDIGALRDLRRFLECLHVGQLSPQQDLSDLAPMDPGLLSAFEAAFLGLNLLHFDYRDGKGAVTERVVEPQAMLILPPLWYLVAWDPQRADFRHFRMDRISKPKALENTSFRRRHVPFDADVCPYNALT